MAHARPFWTSTLQNLTEDSEFFGSEECNEHNSSAEWFVDRISTSPEKLNESNVIRTMVD